MSFVSRFHFLCLQLAICLTFVPVIAEISDAEFKKENLCNAADRIDNSCFVQILADNRLSCFVKCSLNETCDGVLIHSPTALCYHRTTCSFEPVCSIYDSSYVYYRKGDAMTTEAPETTTVTTEPPETTRVTTEPPETTSVTTEPPETTTVTTEPPETTTVTTTEELQTTTTTLAPTTTPEGCQNGGVEQSSGACDCRSTGGYVGTKCERKAATCDELDSYNYASGTYSVNLDLFGDGSVMFETYCTLSYFSHSFEVMRSSGSHDTNLAYTDYVNGFNLGPNDFFLGLENLHRLTTSSSYGVECVVTFKSSTIEGTRGRSHGSFTVASSASGYSISVGGSSGSSSSTSSSGGSTTGFNLDYCLNDNTGVPFSTPDNDQDTSSSNCAQNAQGGWWFKTCSPMTYNPFGWNYNAMPGSETDAHFHAPGFDMSRSSVREAFQYFSLVFEN